MRYLITNINNLINVFIILLPEKEIDLYLLKLTKLSFNSSLMLKKNFGDFVKS